MSENAMDHTTAMRFASKVAFGPRLLDSACWNWTAQIEWDGYGRFWWLGRHWRAHRASFTAAVRPLKPGETIDHLCRNRLCVNPKHMEPVPNKVNLLRGVSYAAMNARKTECKRGHSLSGHNLITQGGRRNCRACKNILQRARRAVPVVGLTELP